MLFTTPEQFIVLGVLLLGGWLLGYASAPSPKKWKRRVREQSDSFTAYHAEAEDRVRASNRRAADLQGELEAVRADHAEAERTIVALRAAAVAMPVAAVVAEPPAPSEVEPEPTREVVAEPVAADITPTTEDHTTRPEVDPVPELARPAPEIPEPVHAEAVAAEASPPEPAATVAVPVAAVVAERPALNAVEPEPKREIVAEPVAADITPTTDDHTAPPKVDTVPEPAPAAIAEPVQVEAAAVIATPKPAEPKQTIEDAVFEPVAPVPMTPTATEAPPAPIGPAEPEMPSTGWFGSSARDALTRIRGIDDGLNARLFQLGVVRFEDIEMLSDEDEMALEQRLALPVGTIARDQWRTQAGLLRSGQNDEQAAHFAPVEPAPVA